MQYELGSRLSRPVKLVLLYERKSNEDRPHLGILILTRAYSRPIVISRRSGDDRYCKQAHALGLSHKETQDEGAQRAYVGERARGLRLRGRLPSQQLLSRSATHEKQHVRHGGEHARRHHPHFLEAVYRAKDAAWLRTKPPPGCGAYPMKSFHLSSGTSEGSIGVAILAGTNVVVSEQRAGTEQP